MKSRSRGISKPMLSLLERDEVASVRPEILRKLAALYKVSYVDLSTAWFCDRFEVEVDDVVATHTFVQSVDRHSASFSIPGQEESPMELISLDRLEAIQGKVPAKTHISVAAVRFLDDGPYYEMVARNLLRGVSYSYLLPEDGYPLYRAFLARVEAEFPKLRGKLDGELTRYYPRVNVDFPVSYAVFKFPDGGVQGYVGLLVNEMVQYFQVADARLSWRMLEGFEWSVEVSSDSQLRKRFSTLGAEFSRRRTDEKKGR